MAQKPIPDSAYQQALDAHHKFGDWSSAAAALSLPESTARRRAKDAIRRGMTPHGAAKDDPRVLKAKISKLEAELKKLSVQSAVSAEIKAIIGSLGDKVSQLEIPSWVNADLRRSSSPGVPKLFLSDFHWGEVVHPSQIGGVNKFNIKIANERLAFTVESAIHLLKILSPEMDYPGIVMPLGGDMISGNIHDELTATNELNSMPCVLDLYGALIGAINRMADTFGKVFLPCVTGNHGRDTKKIWSKDRHHTSFDWLLYQFLAKHFADDKRITFYIPDSSDGLYRIFNVRYLITHGDQFRGGDGIIGPLGPLTRGNQKKQSRNQAVNMEYDVMECGHWHQYIHLERLIVNGSLKGYDEYAYQGNFGFEPPRQALYLTHPVYGITYRMPVLCQHPTRGAAATPEWASFRK
jgi:hypothetical protein